MRTSRQRLRAASGPVVTVVLSLVATVQALRLWDWRPGTPLSLDGDAPHVLMQIRAILDDNWYGVNHTLGAPFGLNQGWFTTADVLNFAMVRVVGFFSDDPATVGALVFLVGFPLAALTAYWLARQLRLSRPAAVLVGVLFSVAPGHQIWFGHLWLAAYWVLPLGLWLVVRVSRGESLRPWPVTVGIVIAVGLADVYYVAFTLVLMAAALLIRLLGGTSLFRLWRPVAVSAAIAALCGISLAVATRGRGGDLVTGALPATRGVGESEAYAGKIIELFLPWYEHRAAPLRFLSTAYGIAAAPSVERPALGVIALAGTVAITGIVLRGLVGRRPTPATWGLLGTLLLICLAFYTRGGLGSLVALFVTPQIRTWSRFVVLIALVGLLAVGLLVTSLGARRGRRAAWPVVAALLLVGVLDQTSPGAAPDYAALRADRAELVAYTSSLSGQLGADCPVFQLPVVAFPEEAPPGTMGDYDHLLPSLVSPTGLSWSYGAIRGTASSDWQFTLPVGDPERLLRDVAAAGFCAVSVDHRGYVATTDPSATAEHLTGPPLATARRAQLTAFDLRPLATGAAAGAGDRVLHPVLASMNGSLVDVDGHAPLQHTGPTATITVSNMGTAPVDVDLSFVVAGVGDQTRDLDVSTPGAADQHGSVSATRQESFSLRLRAKPGTTLVTLSATGDAVSVPRTEGRQVAALVVSDMRLGGPSGGPAAASLQEFAAASPRSER